jgi:hypothetical protein
MHVPPDLSYFFNVANEMGKSVLAIDTIPKEIRNSEKYIPNPEVIKEK